MEPKFGLACWVFRVEHAGIGFSTAWELGSRDSVWRLRHEGLGVRGVQVQILCKFGVSDSSFTVQWFEVWGS